MDLRTLSVPERDMYLVDRIYDTLVGGEERWHSFLSDVRGCHPNGHATLFVHDIAAGAGALSLSAGFDPAWIEKYNTTYAAKNPWMAKASVRPVGLGAPAERMLAREDLLRTEYYADFLRPLGIVSGAGVTILREDGCTFALSVIGAEDEEARTRELAETFGRIAPHLRRIFDLHRREGADPFRAVLPLVDSLQTGLFVVGPGRRLVRSNRFGEMLATSGRGVRLDGQRRLAIESKPGMEALEALLSPHWAARRLPQTLSHIVRDRDGIPLRVTLIASGRSAVETFFGGPRVFVVLEALDSPLQLSAEMLRVLYEFTPAEARVMLALAGGATLTRAAAELGIARETARTHFKHACAKLGVTRQADAMRIICRAGYRMVAPEIFA